MKNFVFNFQLLKIRSRVKGSFTHKIFQGETPMRRNINNYVLFFLVLFLSFDIKSAVLHVSNLSAAVNSGSCVISFNLIDSITSDVVADGTVDVVHAGNIADCVAGALSTNQFSFRHRGIGVTILTYTITITPINDSLIDAGEIRFAAKAEAFGAGDGENNFDSIDVNWAGSTIGARVVAEDQADELALSAVNNSPAPGDPLSIGTSCLTTDAASSGGILPVEAPAFLIGWPTSSMIESDQAIAVLNKNGTGAFGEYELETHTLIFDFTGTLPVTISHVATVKNKNELKINWTTSSETSNAGFRIYGLQGNQRNLLKQKIIPGKLDSIIPTSYTVKINDPMVQNLSAIEISDLDLNGKEMRNGPYLIGEEYGSKPKLAKSSILKYDKQLKEFLHNYRSAIAIKKDTIKRLDIYAAVSNVGLQVINNDDLIAMGINLSNLKAEKIAVSFKGRPIPRYISGLDYSGVWNLNSSIEFMAEEFSDDEALYLNQVNYRIHISKSHVIKLDDPILFQNSTVNLIENNNEYSFTNPSPDPWFDASFFSYNGVPSELVRTFDIPNLPDEGQVTFDLSMAALNSFSGLEQDHHLLIEINDEFSMDSRADGWIYWPISLTVDVGKLNEHNNTLRLTAVGDTGFIMDFYIFNKLSATYEKGFVLANKPVLSIRQGVNYQELYNKETTDLLIISHPMFIGSDLDKYISQRGSEGWKIQVIDLFDIYKSMNDSMATPGAIETFLKLVSEDVNYSHVLLVGAASYDPRGFSGPSVNFIPSRYKFTAPLIQYTPCDACLVDFNQDFVPEKAIGRWPVRSINELVNMIDKTLQWENLPKQSTLVITDKINNGDPNFSMQSERIIDKLYALGLQDTVLIDANQISSFVEAKGRIFNQLEMGKALTFFSGHGSPTQWSKNNLIHYSDIENIANDAFPTILLPMTCYTTYAENPYSDNLSSQWLTAGTNGAVAMIGAATLSSFTENELLMTAMIKHVIGENNTIGEALRLAKEELGTSSKSVIINTNLLGDPTLKISN